jgi:hypothetical protein
LITVLGIVLAGREGISLVHMLDAPREEK